MTKVLESERVRPSYGRSLEYSIDVRALQVFLLVGESTVRRYKADLTDEIEPQINELLSRAEKGLQVLLKKESVLQAKVRSDTAVQSFSVNQYAHNYGCETTNMWADNDLLISPTVAHNRAEILQHVIAKF